MDTLVKYDQAIESALRGHANIASDRDRIDYQVIVDAERENFLLMTIGWEDHRRIHVCLVHIQIIGDKIWIQRDGIEDSVTAELEEAGIPKDKIVLAFYPDHVRPHTGYAIA
jgi:XisI protein